MSANETVDINNQDTNVELKFEAIFDESITTGHIPLMDVIIARIKSKFHIPLALKVLNKIPGGDKLKHLKRIKPIEGTDQAGEANNDDHSFDVVIAKCSYEQSEHSISDIKSTIEKISQEKIFFDYRTQPVPSAPPKTELQLSISSKVWPCKYAKSTYLLRCLDGSILNESERELLKLIVNCLLKDLTKQCLSDRRSISAGVVFHNSNIIATSLVSEKTVSENPMKHAAMVAVDNVAKSCGAGYWNKGPHSICDEEQLRETLNNFRITNKTTNNYDEFIPYLCTNYSIILTEEPCLMCCMALVHSRIRRIFFLDLDTNTKLSKDLAQTDSTLARICYDDQALTRLKLHCDKNINHRYEVWRVHW